ncbi:MAG: type I glyceraldehyde-3-phosphate dehydrogenase [Deltaproteobacteria bacterium]|jgi:glyceraldehyde 3-phosphate dehydrogenase|nr:type I glyceraldehyde-3-phosphate dehydrogenase [Deltaproteobacteria bacterium]
MTRIALNGFGRIGRYMLRLMADDKNEQIVAINARADNKSLAHLFKYDSVHGRFNGEVGVYDDGIVVNGRQIKVTREKPGEWKWKELDIDLVVDNTGKVTDRAGLAQHLACGAKKVILSAPGKDADVTIVMGVNQDDYNPAKHDVISAASCTTNCLAPAAKVLQDNFGIKRGLMTTIHSYTMDQRLQDGSHKDLRRARAAAVSMVPTTTGAAKAIGLVIPELKGKLDGFAVRVPTPNVSMVDLTCELGKSTSAAEVNALMKNAAEGFLKGSLGYCDEPLVSCDFNGSTYGGVVDSLLTAVMDGSMLKIIVWYDNEAGFTNQLVRLCRLISSKL